MKLLTLLALLSTPGSGTIFDETTEKIVVDIPLTEAGLTLVPSGVIL